MQHISIAWYVLWSGVHMSVTSWCSIEMAEWIDMKF